MDSGTHHNLKVRQTSEAMRILASAELRNLPNDDERIVHLSKMTHYSCCVIADAIGTERRRVMRVLKAAEEGKTLPLKRGRPPKLKDEDQQDIVDHVTKRHKSKDGCTPDDVLSMVRYQICIESVFLNESDAGT